MGKKCINKNCKRYNIEDGFFGDEDNLCSSCGSQLITYNAASKDSPAFNLDNKLDYQSGDRTIIGRDNIDTQNVDNRNITTTTSNVVNHISNIQPVVEAFVDCAISGRRISLNESVKCKGCGRIISPKYFVDAKLLCIECCEKKNNTAPSSQQNKPNEVTDKLIPALIPSPNTSTNQQAQARPVVEPIRPTQKKGGSSVFFIIIGLLIVGCAIYFFISKSNTPKNELVVAQTTAEQPKSADTKTTTSTTRPSSSPKTTHTVSASITNAAKTTTKTENESLNTAVKEVSVLDQGKEAYNAGNFSKANLLFTNAAKEGHGEANYYLAQMYQTGKGVSKDIKKTYEYMLKAAEGGYQEAYYLVAEMLRTGNGTESNRANAKKWYEKAALSNSKNADNAAKALTKYY